MNRLIIKDSKRVILSDLRLAKTFLSRLRGLQFKLNLPENQGLYISPCDSIHMCNMFFRIDAVFVDKDLRIVSVREKLLPWLSMVFPVKGAHSVFEIKAGMSSKLGLEIGTQLEIAMD